MGVTGSKVDTLVRLKEAEIGGRLKCEATCANEGWVRGTAQTTAEVCPYEAARAAEFNMRRQQHTHPTETTDGINS